MKKQSDFSDCSPSLREYLRAAFLVTALVLWGFSSVSVAQNANVGIKITLADRLVNAETLNLLELGVNATSGSVKNPLFWLEIVNNDAMNSVAGLKLSIQVASTRQGVLLQLTQAEPGFSLTPRQRVFVASNELINGLPGIEEPIKFDGTFSDFLTKEGRDLQNKSGGFLPNDLYTIKLSLVQGMAEVASSITYLGVKPQQSAVDFFLLQPGGDVGSGASIVSTNPNFRWDGPRNAEYRLIVVKKNKNSDDSAESLIQAALSTDATIKNGVSQSASLLDFEIVDAIVTGNDFTLPPQGVQQIEAGALYYWQIFYISTTKDGQELRPSTIWEFSVPKPGENSVSIERNNAIFEQLAFFISPEIANELKDNGFSLLSIEIDNKTVAGPALLQTVEDIKAKFENGKYKF